MTGEKETLNSTLFSAETRINTILSFLATDQRQSLAMENSLPKSTKSFEELEAWFKGTKRFHQIYLESSIYFCTPRTGEQVAEFKKYFVGSCYQFMSYSYHATKQPEGRVLLSPSRTLALHESLFPKARKYTNPLGLGSLDVSVPNGLQIQDNRGAPKISSVVDYTLTGNEDYFQNKLEVYEQRVQQFPKLFGNTQLVFVIPSRRSGGFIPAAIRESEARVIRMPFSHKQFRRFIDGIFENYRPGDDRNRFTLNQIQESISKRPTGNKGG